MSTKKVVVLISGNGSNLQAIIDKLHKQRIDGTTIEVSAVISNKADAFGLQRAKDANIPALLIASEGACSREAYDEQLKAALDELNADAILLAGFMRILSDDFVNQYQGKMLNIHPSLLPKYTGVNTHQRAIDNGDSEHGATVHFVTPELDSGPTVLQAKVPLFAEDSAAELAERVLTQEHQIYPLAASWLATGRLKMQDNVAYLDGTLLGQFGYAPD